MVSVVMIAYNSARYISTAIEGVVIQRTGFPVQLVVSDDASTDETPLIVKKWAELYPDIVEYHRNDSNLGVQKNYLKAFSYCRGKYLAMCDADDYWICRTKLSRQVEYMEKHPECAICYHRVVNYYEDSHEMSLSNGGGRGNLVFSAEDLSRRNVITNMSALSRVSLIGLDRLPAWLGDVRLLDYAMHMLIASAQKDATLHYMSRPMGVYRQSAKAVWSQAGLNSRFEMAISVRRHLINELSHRPEITENLRKACEDMERIMKEGVAAPAKRKLTSRIRGFVTRFLPVPRP